MQVPYTYYRTLLERLRGHAAQLRYIVIDRIFVWAELQRAQAMRRIEAYERQLIREQVDEAAFWAQQGIETRTGWALPSEPNPYVETTAHENHNTLGYDFDGEYHCRCGAVIHGDSVPALKAEWARHRRRVWDEPSSVEYDPYERKAVSSTAPKSMRLRRQWYMRPLLIEGINLLPEDQREAAWALVRQRLEATS